jgi:large subunit ribosomal protein L23
MAKKEIQTKEEVVNLSLIISPRLTEKASNMSSQNVYTFNVKTDATKLSLAKEIEKIYKVKPVKINIVNQPRKAVFTRGKLGYKSSFKKAQVFLKKGDKINLA